MTHSQWRNSHDKKQAKGGLRHRLICNTTQKILTLHRKISEEWFFDVFWGEYSKFIGLSKFTMIINARESTMHQLNVGPLHLSVEKWRSKEAERYG